MCHYVFRGGGLNKSLKIPFPSSGAPSGSPAPTSKSHSQPCPAGRKWSAKLRSPRWNQCSPRSPPSPSTFQTTSLTQWAPCHRPLAPSGTQHCKYEVFTSLKEAGSDFSLFDSKLMILFEGQSINLIRLEVIDLRRMTFTWIQNYN